MLFLVYITLIAEVVVASAAITLAPAAVIMNLGSTAIKVAISCGLSRNRDDDGGGDDHVHDHDDGLHHDVHDHRSSSHRHLHH